MTEPFRATDAGIIALDTLTKGGLGCVFAVFASTFYAKLPGGLIAVTTPETPLGPLNVRTNLSVADWGAIGLKVGQSLHLSNTLVHIAPLGPIDLHDAYPWHPPKTPKPSHTQLSATLGQLASLSHLPPSEGYGTAIFGPQPPEIAAAADGLARLFRGRKQTFGWATNLLGRGPGLTPAGDDLLGGAMIALHTLGRADLAEILWSQLRTSARERTNPISHALLAVAAQGLGNEPLHSALAASCEGRDQAPALAELDRIGHSSGWDAFAGAVLTFRAAIAPAKADA